MLKTRGKRGSALVLVMVSAVVFSIMVAALYTLFRANTETQAWAKEKIQARFTAEAGVNMAVYMILEGADVPQGHMPIKFIPEGSGDWKFLGEDMGWVQVWVDPHNNNDEVSSANAYEVRAMSKVKSEDQDFSYGLASLILPRNFAVYATFLNHAGGGFYGDDYRFDGPFHSNEPPWVYSETPGRDRDPWFYSFSVAAPYYYYSNGVIKEQATTPHYGNLWMEPYEKMTMGEPFFILNADTVPFGPDKVRWEVTKTAAYNGGLVLDLPDGARMILHKDTLLVKRDESTAEEAYDLAALSKRVVWINNGQSGTVYLKTEEGMGGGTDWRVHGLPDSLAVTIAVTGNIAASGPILYHTMDLANDDLAVMLGILNIYGNFYIALDPDLVSGYDDWKDTRWDISTSDKDYPKGLEVDAVIMVLGGEFVLEDTSDPSYWPSPAVDFAIVGGYIVDEEGVTTWVGGGSDQGYYTFCVYDPRLMTRHPPFFPQTGIWDVAYWDERPTMNDDPASTDYIGRDML